MVYEQHKTGMVETTFEKVKDNTKISDYPCIYMHR